MRYLTVLMLLAAANAAAYYPDYFPLSPGNQWIYQQSGAGAGEPVLIEVKRVEVIDDNSFALVTGFPSGDAWLRLTEDGTLLAWDPELRRVRPWIPFGAPVENVFSTEITPCNNAGQILSRWARLESAIGELQNALEIAYTTSCADAGLTGEFYLPYVGLVRRTETTIAGPRTWELIYARLGGVTFVTAPELSFHLALNRAVFEAGQDPSELIARITLRNTRLDPIEITFPTTQRFDLAIRNEAGDTVYQWSADKVFAEVITKEEISSGERNWIVRTNLAGDSGPLPEGTYTVEAWLTAMPPTRFSASGTFVVREQGRVGDSLRAVSPRSQTRNSR